MNEIVRTFVHPAGVHQSLAVCDLTQDGLHLFDDLLQGSCVVAVYSDPPWSPGNEKWWRRHAGVSPPTDYSVLLDAWCRCVTACKPEHIFCEQSINPKHKALLLDAAARCIDWRLPLIEDWVVQYGSPKRPNTLLHFGHTRLDVDPSGMTGEPMTRMVLSGLNLRRPQMIVDPCMGFGMTSRLAHEFKCHFFGTELDPKRLDRAAMWLRKKGYCEK